ncbi:MAG: DUF2771 domain-containing protein [Mycobacterium sp.]
MKRSAAVLLVVLVMLASAGAGVGAWLLARDSGPQQPQISAYSAGQLSRVEPYLYCNVLDLNDCQITQAQGELAVNPRNPVQLSVDSVIGRAPWRLLRVYQNPVDTTSTVFRPKTTLAVTIPTVDPQRGLLRGLVVQLLTLVVDPAGQLYDVPHAEWSVRMVWG